MSFTAVKGIVTRNSNSSSSSDDASTAAARTIVFGLPNLTSIIAAMLGKGCVLPFAMVCKSCYIGTNVAGLQLKSNMNEICSSIALLSWARSQSNPCPWDAKTCSRAAKGGNLAVLQWMRAQSAPCAWSGNTCEAADEAATGIMFYHW